MFLRKVLYVYVLRVKTWVQEVACFSELLFLFVYTHYFKWSVVRFSQQQWASLYQPLIFSDELSQADAAGDPFLNKLDPTKAFKGKAKVPPPQKKQLAQCSSGGAAKSQGNTGRLSGAKRWKRSQSRKKETAQCYCLNCMVSKTDRPLFIH